jgi:hypothetical protein
MNITLRSLCAASLLACTVSAFADDIYYKSSTTDNLNQEAYKFTEATTAAEKAEGKTVYQLMVPHITSGFYLLDGETTLGTAEAATLAQTQVTTDGVTYTLTEASDSSNPNLISPVKSTDDDDEVIEHVLLQLTVEKDGKTSLEVLKPTNDNIREGVPSFLYVSTEASAAAVTDPNPSYRLIKGAGNQYYLHFDSFGGYNNGNPNSIRIIEPALNGENCINLGTASSGGGIYDWSGLYHTETGVDVTTNTGINVTTKLSENNLSCNLYQTSATDAATGSLFVGAVLTNFDIIFEYDIETNALNEGKNLTVFDDTDQYVYNGVLHLNFGESFAIRNFDGTSTILTKSGTDANGNDIYTYTFSASEDSPYINAFYIEGYNGASDATATTITNFSGNTTDKNIATDYNYNGTTMNLDTFTTSDTQKTPVVNAEELLYYYVNSTNAVTIEFHYNSSNPADSKIVVNTTGTMTGSAAIEVSDSECEVEYYNLNGVRVNATTPGLYIRRQGKQVSKVVIR